MTTADTPWTRTIAGRPERGASASRSRTTGMRDVEMFTEMTGDRNPVHYDATLATASPFGGLIVQGGVTTSWRRPGSSPRRSRSARPSPRR